MHMRHLHTVCNTKTRKNRTETWSWGSKNKAHSDFSRIYGKVVREAKQVCVCVCVSGWRYKTLVGSKICSSLKKHTESGGLNSTNHCEPCVICVCVERRLDRNWCSECLYELWEAQTLPIRRITCCSRLLEETRISKGKSFAPQEHSTDTHLEIQCVCTGDFTCSHSEKSQCCALGMRSRKMSATKCSPPILSHRQNVLAAKVFSPPKCSLRQYVVGA